jgi:serine kinase of HPr protein (carbohydrate metabolism regulator)
MSTKGTPPKSQSELLVHGTCVALGDWSVLLRGAPGSGKSDLALRLIDRGAILVSDDQVALSPSGGFLRASPPRQIAGLFEVRGVGIVQKPYITKVPVALLIDLVPADQVPRLPDASTDTLLDVDLPVLRLAPFEASAPIKIELALSSLID